MATPGSATKANPVKGISKILRLTAENEASATLMARVFEAGIFIQRVSGALVITDGVTALSALTPIVDKALSAAEKTALNNAYGTGTYVAAANGVVQHGADGKIAKESLSIVGADGKITLESLPDAATGGLSFFADYTALQAATDLQKKTLCMVIDASGDPTVDAGTATYAWNGTAWLKVSEQESLDIDVSSIECSATNVEAAGAIMYDHPVVLGMTVTEYEALAFPVAP